MPRSPSPPFFNKKEMLELAQGLQHSNFPEVSELAKAYIELSSQFDELKHKYVMEMAEQVMSKHYNLLKKLED